MQAEERKESWTKQELKTVDLGDKRLNRRLGNILETLSHQPSKSIPTACRSWSETKAAYRFFGHAKVKEEKILEPHNKATLERMKQEEVVLLPQDTTELDFSGKQDIVGLGKLSGHEQRQGIYVHPTLAVTRGRLCLGVVHTKWWIRESYGIRGERKKKSIEEKESYRWVESFRATKALSKELPGTLLVNIADREGDIYEFFLETEAEGIFKEEKAHWIIRAGQDRKVLEEQGKLWETVSKTDCIGEIEFIMPGGRGRKKRVVRQRIYTAEVTLKSPWRRGKKLSNVKVRAVLAKEEEVPAGEKPIEWLLLTSLPVGRKSEALDVMEWYLCRWQIEIYFKVLKSGCEVEELQLEAVERLKSCLAVYMIVAWRILFTTMIGRQCPEMSCAKLFEEEEWKSVYVVVHRKPPPEEAPPLEQMVKMIASLGGFLNRKGDKYPGVQTLWIGIQRMKDFALAWQLFNTPQIGRTYG